jgi:hypothetical protein
MEGVQAAMTTGNLEPVQCRNMEEWRLVSGSSLCLYLLCGNSSLVGGLFYVCMIFAFLVRMPIFIVHL